MEDINSADEQRYRCFLPDQKQPKPEPEKEPVINTAQGLVMAHDSGYYQFAGLSLPAESDLEGAQLDDAQFGLAIVDGVNFRNAHLNRADFSGASLNGARLANAEMVGAHLNDCDLNETDLRGAKLAATTWSDAFWDEETPPKLNQQTRLIPESWHEAPQDAESIIAVNRQFEGLDDRMLDQLLIQIAPVQRQILEKMLYQPPLVLNMENWRNQRKQVAEKRVSPYSPQL